MIALYETHQRTITKVITWRILLSISHFVTGFFLTGSWVIGLQIVGIANVVNNALFWLHERCWNVVIWNRELNSQHIFTEKKSRSTIKILTWRVLITSSNFLIPFLVTSNGKTSALFLFISTTINILIFWSHERLWNTISWGKIVDR
jgi:uncharacterized membrane protein